LIRTEFGLFLNKMGFSLVLLIDPAILPAKAPMSHQLLANSNLKHTFSVDMIPYYNPLILLVIFYP